MLFATVSVAQHKCSCPEWMGSIPHKNALKTYKLPSSQLTIGLCGNLETDYTDIKDTIYSEAYVFNCKSEEILHEWSALQKCYVKQLEDSIVIGEYFLIPVGKNLALEWRPFLITELYLELNKIQKQQYFLTKEYNYTQQEIVTVIKRYQTTTHNSYSWNSLKYLDICYQLFWCYVSGSEKALLYLKEAKEKFGGFSGHAAEEYSNLLRTAKKIIELKSNTTE